MTFGPIQARSVIQTFVGADGRALEFQIFDAGTERDVSSADITLKLYAQRGNVQKIDGVTMTKDVLVAESAGEHGACSYTPTAAMIDTAGDMDAVIEVVDTSGVDDVLDYVYPFVIRVLAVPTSVT